MDDQINMISGDDTVIEFKDYEQVVTNWFPYRRRLYVKRINRQIILLRLKIMMYENMVKFSKKHDTYGINRKMKRDRVDGLLMEHKYVKFNKSLLENPGYTPIKDLERLILKENAKYDYLVNLRYSDLIDDACKRREARLLEFKKALEELLNDDGSDGTFAGRKAWIRELDQLEETIALGLKKGWYYGEKEPGKFRK